MTNTLWSKCGYEGIDFDPETKTVSYNPSHEDNVDTSLENNPTSDGEYDYL